MQISTLLIDASDIARNGCLHLFGSDLRFRTIGDTNTAGKMVAACNGERPDLIVFDAAAAGEFDEAAVRDVLAKAPGANLLVLTDARNASFALRCLNLGVRGYMLKSTTPGSVLLDAAYVVGCGAGVFIDGTLLSSIRSLSGGADLVPIAPNLQRLPLTAREQQVLDLLVEGLSDGEVAERLGIARTTIHTHVSTIMRKVQALNRIQLGRLASQDADSVQPFPLRSSQRKAS
jgi:DNA-binding NarL/FixJ family response regulator